MAPGRGSQGFGAWQISSAECSPKPPRILTTSNRRTPCVGGQGGDCPSVGCAQPTAASNASARRSLRPRWSAPGPSVASRGSHSSVVDGATYQVGRQTPVLAPVPVAKMSGRSRSFSPTPKKQSYPMSARSQVQLVFDPSPGRPPPSTTMESLRNSGTCSPCSPRPPDARSPLPLAPSLSSMPHRTRTPRVTIDLAMPVQQPLGRSASGSLRASPARGRASEATPAGHSRSGSPTVCSSLLESPPGGGCRSSAPPVANGRAGSPPSARYRAGSPTGGATGRVSAEDAAVARRKAIEAQLAAATGAVADARQMLSHQPMRAAAYDQLGDSILEESLARMVSSIEASLDLASNCAGKIHKAGGTAARGALASGRCLLPPRRPKPLVTDGGTCSGDEKVAGHVVAVRSARPGGLKVAPPSPLSVRRGGRHSAPGMGGMPARLVQSPTCER